MAVLLMAPAVGSEQRLGGQIQSTAGRGAAQTPPPQQGRSQAPPPAAGQPQAGQRPPLSADQFLSRSLWWKDDAVRKEMKLTDAQVRTISQIFDSRVKYVMPYVEEYNKQLAELNRMTLERTVEVSTYEIQVSRVEQLRSKLNETRTVMFYRIYRLLDPAQNQSLQEIRDRGGRGRGGGPTPRTW